MAVRDKSANFPSEEAVPGIWWGMDYWEPEFIRAAMAPSNWDERALHHIEEHLDAEATAQGAYDELAGNGDPAIRYLARLIGADERRHHQILDNIASALRARLSGEEITPSETETVPLTTEQRETLLAETRRLLELERADAVALKELRADLRPAKDETLWPLLAEIMAADTDKHVRILKAIERRLKRS
jgi:hypothetical protein